MSDDTPSRPAPETPLERALRRFEVQAALYQLDMERLDREHADQHQEEFRYLMYRLGRAERPAGIFPFPFF